MNISVYFKNIFTNLRILVILLVFFLASCSSFNSDKKNEQNENQIVKKKRIEPNVEKRARAAADAGGGIFNSNRSGSTTYDFATSNVLWRATLESLETIPLSVVDYSGGMVVTDWYSGQQQSNNDKNESVKITVRFLSDELKVGSIKIISHQKNCNNSNKCSIRLMSNNFNIKLKNAIMNKARNLKIKDEKKK